MGKRGRQKFLWSILSKPSKEETIMNSRTSSIRAMQDKQPYEKKELDRTEILRLKRSILPHVQRVMACKNITYKKTVLIEDKYHYFFVTEENEVNESEMFMVEPQSGILQFENFERQIDL